jgi:hypothetical protein
MPLEFLRDTPDVAFKRTIRDLQTMNPSIDESVFERMSIAQIDTVLDRLYERETRIVNESPYGAWLADPVFVQIKMLQDGLTNLREHREILEESEVLVPGFTYYNDIRQFGKRIEGKTCTYLGEGRPTNWINFIDSVPVMKALEVVRHGDVGDFRRIYVEIANGRADGLENVSVEHITESSDSALMEMEHYCDARWEGLWPWEIQSPYRIGRIIEENKQMRQQTLNEMHEILNNLLLEFDATGQEQFEIVSMARNMSENMQAMIEKLAKLTGDGIINLKAMVMTKMGDEAAMKVEHGITQPLNQCADAMARLKANLDALVNELQNHQPSDLDQMGGQMGPDGMPPDMGGMEGGDMGMAANDNAAQMGAPANDNMDQMGGAANAVPAAPGAIPGTDNMIQPERARKKA